MQELRLGLIGFGCVGRGLHDVLQMSARKSPQIIRIAVKDPLKKRADLKIPFTFSAKELILDPNINTIVELIDDHEAAFHFAMETIKAGKNFITANKRMLAYHLPELISLAHERKVSLLYEAAACGSIPIIRNLDEYYDNDFLSQFNAIVNGTCNYLLTRMEEEGMPFPEALEEAQRMGFAESNPALDIDGRDALYKCVILLLHSFGSHFHPDQIMCWGIRNIKQEDIQLAERLQCKIRLIARAHRDNNSKITAMVCPILVAKGTSMYSIQNEMNAVELRTAFADDQLMAGKGAGAFPTGSAVLSDISACAYGYKYEYKKQSNGSNSTMNYCQRQSVRLSGSNQVLDQVATLLKGQDVDHYKINNALYTTCPISLLQLLQVQFYTKGLFCLCISREQEAQARQMEQVPKAMLKQ
jgi:homoserine dehydrogenase